MSSTELHDLAGGSKCKSCGAFLPINQVCPYCQTQEKRLEENQSEASPKQEQENSQPPLIAVVFAALIGFMLHPLLGVVVVVFAITRTRGIGALLLVALLILLALAGLITSFGHGFFGK